jgi:hypothetical protein
MAHSAFNEEESDTPNPYTEEECVKMIFDDPEACQEQIKSLDLVKFAEHIVENVRLSCCNLSILFEIDGDCNRYWDV